MHLAKGSRKTEVQNAKWTCSFTPGSNKAVVHMNLRQVKLLSRPIFWSDSWMNAPNVSTLSSTADHHLSKKTKTQAHCYKQGWRSAGKWGRVGVGPLCAYESHSQPHLHPISVSLISNINHMRRSAGLTALTHTHACVSKTRHRRSKKEAAWEERAWRRLLLSATCWNLYYTHSDNPSDPSGSNRNTDFVLKYEANVSRTLIRSSLELEHWAGGLTGMVPYQDHPKRQSNWLVRLFLKVSRALVGLMLKNVKMHLKT